MGDTLIDWATKVWNPVTGCSKVSEGCRHCYAERMAKRLAGRAGYDREQPFKVTWHGDDKLLLPMTWAKPQRVFVDSMGDLGHPDVDRNWLSDMFTVMEQYDSHIYLILTKRIEELAESLEWVRKEGDWKRWPLPNVWLGITAEDQAMLDRRWMYLSKIKAAVRFISYEPALGPQDYSDLFGLYEIEDGKWDLKVGSRWADSPDWIIAGGESGPGARPAHPDWFRAVRDQCVAAGVPFFFKQWGQWAPCDAGELPGTFVHPSGGWPYPNKPDGGIGVERMVKVRGKRAGHLLDGVEWRQFPEVPR